MSEIKLTADSGGGTTSIKAPSSTTSNADVVLKLPVADGSANQVLKTDGSGQLSFGSDISDLVNDTSPQLGGDLDSNGNNIKITDGEELRLGDGNDLVIKHDGSHSYINDNGSGNLYLSVGGAFYIQNQAQDEALAIFNENGSCELYHNNSLKFQTVSSGTKWTGDLNCDDNSKIKIGNSQDLEIYHDGSDSFIDDAGTGNLFIRSSQVQINKYTGENMIKAVADGAVFLYHDDSVRFETTQYGAKITSGTNDNGKLEFKSGNHDYSCIGYTGLNRFAIDGHDGLEVRDPSDSYATRMKIGSDGKFHVFGNVASENAQLFHNISSTNPEGLYIHFPNAAPNTSSRHFLKASDSNSTRIVIDSNGNLRNINNSYGAISDISLKENIVDASSQWNDVKNIKVRVFNFKTESASDKRIGVVAQEIETVCPKLVDISYDKDAEGNLLETGVKSVKYSVLYMKAIKALQEAQARIETLETKVAALEGA